MDRARVLACLAVVLVASGGIYTYYAFSAGQSWDETFHVKSSLVSPSKFWTEEGYAYSTDHPSIKRHVYRWALHRIGVRSLNIPDVDYSKSEKWNIDAGRLPSMAIVIPLRLVNAAFMTAALVLVFFAALVILRNPYLSLAVVLPLVLSERIAMGVVAYLGCDAILAFTLALSLFAFVMITRRGTAPSLWGVLILGVTGALAVSTKFNGALVIIAFCGYLVIVNKGIDRFFRPLMAAVACAAVFAALNPIVRGGGLNYALGVVWDMLGRRGYIWEKQFEQFPLSRAALVSRFFPWTAFLLPLGAALVRLRREKWVLPVTVWVVVLVSGTLVSVNRTYARYFLPVEMATFFATGVAGWRLLQACLAKRESERASLPAGRIPGAILIGISAALIMVAIAAVAVPLGVERVRAGSVTGKARLFARQSIAYYGLGPVLTAAESTLLLALPRAAEEQSLEWTGDATAGTLVRRTLTTAVLLAAMVLALVAGRNAIGKGLPAVAAILPFVWSQLVGSRYLTLSFSEALVLAFTAASASLFLRRRAPDGPMSWSKVIVCAILASAAVAASPKGILLAGVIAAWIVAVNGVRSTATRVAAAVAIAAVFFPIFESLEWLVGAKDLSDWVIAIRTGHLRFWTARFGETTDFLMPLGECFAWWPMLPFAGAVLYAVRKESWSGPAALWLSFVLGGAILTMSSRLSQSPDVDFALSLGMGLAGLALAGRDICVTVQLREPCDAP